MKVPKMSVKIDLSGFSGNWVAIEDDIVISSDKKIDNVLESIKNKPVDKISLLKVPEKNQILIL